MVDTRNNFRFVEVVNHDDRENYTKLVLKKVYTLPVDKTDDNAPRRISSRVEEMRKNFEPSSNGFSYLRPSLFTPKPFSSSTSNLSHNMNDSYNSNDDPIYANKPRPMVPPKPCYKKPPPLPIFDNDRPKCASPVPELPPISRNTPRTTNHSEDPNQFLNNLKNIKNLRMSNKNHQSVIESKNNLRNDHRNNNTHNDNNNKNRSLNNNYNNNNNRSMNNSSTPSPPPPPPSQVKIMNGRSSSTCTLLSSSNVISPKTMKSNNNINNHNQSVTTSPKYKELFEQKSQIRERLFSKIEVLREEERELANEKVEIDFMSRRFYVRLLNKNESDADKFSQFIQEIQQITKLKSGLLLRLDKLENGGHIKYSADEVMKKRVQLQGQILEAENLQKNTDRRRKVQDRIIQSHFAHEDFIEFQGMIEGLTRIVREQREMEHKITLGNDKLRALDDIG
eukprot:TRINITY_DN3954_c0_g1_i1.p1 TRINITY_DN3954_c0_g1~~TRINITY_DN3954_c0_g1_i1.p1  ORF type:complete len:450 (+),score=115.46 TRINITY_DN3954_c0_g1_i1:160-1509(+)